METLITVIGRGHSGTRAISHTLSASGVYMGSQQNPSGDKIPPHAMYDACRVMAQYVKWNGGLSWNFEPLFTMPIDPEFEQLINTYLADVLRDKSIYKGWKIPETTLIYPWIVRMFPEIRYIHWIRDPRIVFWVVTKQIICVTLALNINKLTTYTKDVRSLGIINIS